MRPITLVAILALTIGGCGGRSSNNGDGGTPQQDAAGDAAVQPQNDAALQNDASSPTGWPSPGRIACGDTTCDAATQVCCGLPGDGGFQDVTYSCIGTGDTCGGTTVACDEPGDCTGGNICCRMGGGGGGGVSCVAAASCTGNGARQLCHVDADCPTDTPACCASQYGGAATCRTACDTGDGGTPNRDGGNPDGSRPDGGGGSIGTPSPGSVACGNASCDVATQYCCVTGSGGSRTYTCTNNADTCAGNSTKCDEPGDCTGGQVCCRASGANDTLCADAANCSATGDRQRCHADTDCTTTGLTQCCPSTGNVGTCSAPGSC